MRDLGSNCNQCFALELGFGMGSSWDLSQPQLRAAQRDGNHQRDLVPTFPSQPTSVFSLQSSHWYCSSSYPRSSHLFLLNLEQRMDKAKESSGGNGISNGMHEGGRGVKT